MTYKITFKKSVSNDLKKIDKQEIIRIFNKLENNSALNALNADSYPELQGQFAGLRKFRIGNYRVIFAIIDDIILITRIQHRKNVYKIRS